MYTLEDTARRYTFYCDNSERIVTIVVPTDRTQTPRIVTAACVVEMTREETVYQLTNFRRMVRDGYRQYRKGW